MQEDDEGIHYTKPEHMLTRIALVLWHCRRLARHENTKPENPVFINSDENPILTACFSPSELKACGESTRNSDATLYRQLVLARRDLRRLFTIGSLPQKRNKIRLFEQVPTDTTAIYFSDEESVDELDGAKDDNSANAVFQYEESDAEEEEFISPIFY